MNHDGEFDAVDQKAAKEYFQQWNILEKKCPFCGDVKWLDVEHIISGQIMLPKGEVRIGPNATMYPQVQLICGTCGYTALFNAVVAGLADFRVSDTAAPKGMEAANE